MGVSTFSTRVIHPQLTCYATFVDTTIPPPALQRSRRGGLLEGASRFSSNVLTPFEEKREAWLSARASRPARKCFNVFYWSRLPAAHLILDICRHRLDTGHLSTPPRNPRQKYCARRCLSLSLFLSHTHTTHFSLFLSPSLTLTHTLQQAHTPRRLRSNSSKRHGLPLARPARQARVEVRRQSTCSMHVN